MCVCACVFRIIVRLLVNHAMKRKNFFFIGNLRIYYIYTIYIYIYTHTLSIHDLTKIEQIVKCATIGSAVARGGAV